MAIVMAYIKTATARAEAARESTKTAMSREICWVAIGSRIWPSYLFLPRATQPNFPALVCIESPAGPMVYRVAADELTLFDHLERRQDGPTTYIAGDKMIALLHLATEGW